MLLMRLSPSYKAYKNFEWILKSHTNIIMPDEDKAEEEPPKTVCSRAVAEMIADKPYKIVYYNNAPIYLVILSRKRKEGMEGGIGFAFYDEKREFFGGEVAEFLMSDKSLKLRELQVRATAGLEETLKEVKKSGLAGGSPEQN
jgi:hypothetical protein